MKVKFRTYSGEAGNPQLLLIAKSESGHEVSELFNAVGIFSNWNLKRARKKLLKELELLTDYESK